MSAKTVFFSIILIGSFSGCVGEQSPQPPVDNGAEPASNPNSPRQQSSQEKIIAVPVEKVAEPIDLDEGIGEF